MYVHSNSEAFTPAYAPMSKEEAWLSFLVVTSNCTFVDRVVQVQDKTV